jgi:RNA-binding protein YlmH
LDPNIIDSNQEEEEVVPAVRADVVIEELVEMSKDVAREALYEALTFYISACVNLIFS